MDYPLLENLDKITHGKLPSKLLISVTFLGIFLILLIGFHSPNFPGSQWWHFHNFTKPQLSVLINSNSSQGVVKEVLPSRKPQNGNATGVKQVFPKRGALIVNTSSCKIPNLDPWDKSVGKLKKKCSTKDETDPKCWARDGNKNWIYAQGSKLLWNNTAISKSGYKKESLNCCYRIIRRLEQPLHNFNSKADTVTILSQNCNRISLHNVTDISTDFIKVTCMFSISPKWFKTVFEQNFAFAFPNAHAQKKISQWKSLSANSSEGQIPPSVVILGIDTNSRLNSHRRLPRTLKVLQDLEAVEMFGYHKVGDNTLPNTIAFLAGMTSQDMLRKCYPNKQGSFDGCPFIWKDFDRAGYLTATAEDDAFLTSFNHLHHGFVVKPVDFYYRPFVLASTTHAGNVKCIGHNTTMEVLLNYLGDILHRASDGAPVFIHSWASFFSHDCINTLRFADDTIAKFIERMDKQNTILLFMSDHGDRHGAFRETVMGWYEDRLPSMWIYLPEMVRKRWPQWHSNLMLNADRVTSHFDVYHTFVQILDAHKVDPGFRVNVPTKKVGQSLLTTIPQNRTCNQAGIPASYCVCSKLTTVVSNTKKNEINTSTRKVTEASLSFLRKMLPQDCATLKVKKIVSTLQRDSTDGGKIYVVTFYTDPGHYLFEVTAKAKNASKEDGRPDLKSFVVDNYDSISRISKMDSHRDCYKDTIWEKYCYCL